MNEEHTLEEVIQALKNQRFWPNQATLDEDLQNAIETMEWMSSELIQHNKLWIQLLDHIQQQHGTDDE
jgi:hypothetical protein